MNILVIGNGFDLAHYLPTQYRDFLEFVKACNNSDNEYRPFVESLKSINKDKYLEIKSLMESNKLLDYFLSIYAERCENGLVGWIDFEGEISDIVQALDKAKQDIERKTSGANGIATLDESLFEKLKPLIFADYKKESISTIDRYSFQSSLFDDKAKTLLEDLNRLTRLLELYLYEYVERQNNTYVLPDIQNISFDYVLSFNYTETYKKKYDPEGNSTYCYVHGKAQDGNLDDCNLVLGIDEYLPEERRDLDNQFLRYKKFYQRIFKQTETIYSDWIDAVNNFIGKPRIAGNPIANVYIYGHSLDITDKDILSRLILMKHTETHIFYHNREAKAKQISNLVKVIGEDNLIRMTVGNKPAISFVQSKPAIESSADNE